MESNCSEISENYIKNSNDLIPNDEKFESILQPVLAMIQHKLKGNYLYGEEYLIKFLQQRRTKVETEDILNLSKHMSACVAHLYIILISMILSFTLGFPLAFCLKTCYKKISSPSKYRYWLFTLSVLFAGAMAFLLIGSVTSWNIGIKAQRYVDRFPKECLNAVQTINRTKLGFKENCEKLHLVVDWNLMKVTNSTLKIYEDVDKIIDETTSVDYLLSLEKFNNSVNNLEKVFYSIGFMNVDLKPTSRLVKTIDQLYYQTKGISQYFDATFSREDDAIAAGKRMIPDIVFPRDYVYPNWEEFYYDVSTTLDVLFPNMNSTIRFVDIIKRNLKNVHDKNLEKLAEQIRQIQDFISSKCAIMSNAIELLVPERTEYRISRVSAKLDRLTSYSLVPRNCTSDFMKLRTWIFLFPSIYGFIVFFIFLIGFIGACKEVYSTSNGKITTGAYTVAFFKVAIRFSVTFLWLVLLVAGILYLMHIPMTVICGTIKTNKLTERFLDRPYWKNETWIMSNLNKYVPKLQNAITIESILTGCRNNITIIRSLNLEEHINKHNNFSLKELIQQSKEDYTAVIKRQTSANLNDILHYVNLIDSHMDMGYILEIQNNLNSSYNGIGLLQKKISSMNLPDQFLIENVLDDIHYLLEQLNIFLEEFVKAKLLVQVAKSELLELQTINNRLVNITKTYLYAEVNVYLENITEHIKCLYQPTEKFIKQSLLYGFGDCGFLPYIYDELKWFVCDYGLELMNSLWLSLAIIGFSIIIATILACRIGGYVRGTYKIHGRYLLSCQRYSDKQSTIVNQMDTTVGNTK